VWPVYLVNGCVSFNMGYRNPRGPITRLGFTKDNGYGLALALTASGGAIIA
jgi:hypothetical protein